MAVKNLIIILAFAFASPMITAQTPTPTKTRTVEFTTTIAYVIIDGMACQEGCADIIAKNIEEAKGVQSAKVSYAEGKAIIKYDDAHIKISEIEDIIKGTKVKDYVYVIKNTVLKNQIVR